MFYFEQDKREIRSWLKVADDKVRDELRTEIQQEIRRQQDKFINEQLKQYDANFRADAEILIGNKARENNLWVTEKIAAVQKTFADFIADDFDRLKNSSDATAQEVNKLKAKVDGWQAPSPAPLPEVDALKAEVTTLTAENAALKNQLDQHDKNFAVVTKALNDIQKNFFGHLQQRDAQILSLKTELDKLKAEVDALKQQVADHEQRIVKLEPPPEVPDDEKFFLPAQSTEFIPVDRKKISAKVKEALNLRDAEKFLNANSSTTSKQFQKLLAAHTKEVKRFVDKLKPDDLDEAELSETVTAKYFKLFQRTIFDNILIAIRRGLKTSDKTFYADFLKKLNDYLTRCGIYSLNVKADRQADSDDYENMTPQTLKADDENPSGKIGSIERLPYRINYLDEFGEQKFLQHAGIMNVYKAV